MARLTRPPARLGAAPKVLGAVDRAAAERERDRVRAAEDAARKLYRTARWRRLRLDVLARDGWQCRQTGVLLRGKAPAPDSPVIDHIRPHRGDLALFWDIDNLQAVSKAWHDGAKQRIDKAAARADRPRG